MLNVAAEYWQEQFSDDESFRHHSQQNQRIANDFLVSCRRHPSIMEALRSREIIEIGCGSGDFAWKIKDEFGSGVYYATDFSRAAVERAQQRHPSINFWVYDVLNDAPFRSFDLVICSNVLEHFKIPHTVINRMFHLAPKLLILVPYRQPITDGYDSEGGAGHVHSFDESVFDPYDLIESFTFTTQGWQYRSGDELPLQLAVLIRERP